MKIIEEKKKKLIIFPRIIFSVFILIIVLALPLIIISGSESFYKNRLEKSNCYEMISEKDCIDLSMNALNFLKGKESLDSRYSAREQSHFFDVKVIFDFTKALMLALSFFVIIYLAIFFMLDKTEIYRTLKLAGFLIVGFLGFLIAMIAISFQTTFYAFHALFFPQGNWSFPFDFTIITVFPEEFFVHAATTSFLISFGAGLVLLGVGYLYLEKSKRKLKK